MSWAVEFLDEARRDMRTDDEVYREAAKRLGR